MRPLLNSLPTVPGALRAPEIVGTGALRAPEIAGTGALLAPEIAAGAPAP